MAINDDNFEFSHVFQDFSRAAGFSIDVSKTPLLLKLVLDILKIEFPTLYEIKKTYARQRPFIGNDQPTCMVDKEQIRRDPSYPSGHTMSGTTISFLLAALLPDRAEALYLRGRTFSESRIVCGAHWASDVATGYQLAVQQVNLVMRRPEIAAQLPAVQRELEALRAKGTEPAAAQCTLEKSGAAHSPLLLP